jgi:hypothetical protein
MRKSAAILATLVGLPIATPVCAMKPADHMPGGLELELAIHCGRLAGQFDNAAAQGHLGRQHDRAWEERRQGQALCAKGDLEAGIAILEDALDAIGLVPIPAPQPGARSAAGAGNRVR